MTGILPINTGLSEIVGSIPEGPASKIVAFLASRYPGPASRKELMAAAQFHGHWTDRLTAHVRFEIAINWLNWQMRPKGWGIAEPDFSTVFWGSIDDNIANYRLIPTRRKA